MTKRKYKVFIDIVLVLLCLFPLICTCIALNRSTNFVNEGDVVEFINRFAISNELAPADRKLFDYILGL